MGSCVYYRAVLLDYLYDLLEDDESQKLRNHLESCDSCRAALLQAQGQQKLLATAARLPFPGVRFEAPLTTESSAGPATLKLPARLPRGNWGRYVAAAAVLLAVGGAAAVWYGNGRETGGGVETVVAAGPRPPNEPEHVWKPATP